MTTLLAGIAEFERSLIKARTDVGIKRAREAGVRFGRPSKLTKHQQQQAFKLLNQGEPQTAVARLLNVDQSTISRLAHAASQSRVKLGAWHTSGHELAMQEARV
jgi:DNA invertase Pin-like site-specific DNA recombinase